MKSEVKKKMGISEQISEIRERDEDDYFHWCHLILGHKGDFEKCPECHKHLKDKK